MSDPAKPTRFATIRLLGRDSRVEHIVYFLCTEWSELLYLLQDPVSYMKAQSFLWPQVPEEEHAEWQLLAPVTADFSHGPDDLQAAQQAAAFYLGSHAMSLADEGQKTFVDFLNQTEGQVPPEVTRALEGAFFVSFATYTSQLSVTYFPPKAPPAPGKAPELKKLAIQVFNPSGAAPSFATLHADLPSSAIARARHVFNILSNPGWLYGFLKDKPIEVEDYKPVPERTSIRAGRTGQPVPQVKASFRAEGAGYPHVPMSVHGLGDLPSANHCQITKGIMKQAPSSTLFLPTRCDLQTYKHALYDFESSVAHATKGSQG